jgi:uncharacterized repeat protein (TIGR03806 family)
MNASFRALPFVIALAAALLSPADQEASQELQGAGLERAYPRLRFERPIFLTSSNDGSGRVFVAEQDGVIRVFDGGDDSVAESRVFLDIREQVSRQMNEEGLLGLAFHPDYKTNGLFFVHYSSLAPDKTGVVARFKVSKSDPNVADPASEVEILRQRQPYRNHNGGGLEFGPDGYLYISFGDGGAAGDPEGSGQDLSTWLGAILRIDVNRQEGGYSVPKDNPFLQKADAAPEIWAYGFRNVWRFSFDRDTGELWAGDVGQDKWEEVSRVVRGGNYGWKTFEALVEFDKDVPLASEPHIEPVAVYGRELGISITGGNVYRGARHPELLGSYFFGDYFTGNLWRLTKSDAGYTSELARRTGRSIASFGEDEDGELFVLSFDGGIYRIVPTAEGENTFEDWPASLADTGLFADARRMEPAQGVLPYEVRAAFWSDGADKQRFLSVPEGQALGYRSHGSWDVPVGTTLVKNFAIPGRRRPRNLETRLIKRVAEGWEAATYIWDERGRRATLAPAGQQFELWSRSGVASWHGPSSSECGACHVDEAGFVLGLTTAQLNSGDQLESLAKHGLVQLPDDFEAASAPRLADPYGDGELESRARTWLDVNCAMCHMPNGRGNASIDLRLSTPLAETQLVDAEPMQGDFGLEGARLVVPGHPERSVLLHRVETLGDGRMPNIGSNQVDEDGVRLLRAWIKALDQQ